MDKKMFYASMNTTMKWTKPTALVDDTGKIKIFFYGLYMSITPDQWLELSEAVVIAMQEDEKKEAHE